MTTELRWRTTLFIFLIISIISLIWAIGANSRKKVELQKSKELNARLEKLTRANTVITTDLKTIRNKLSELKQSGKTQAEALIEESQNKQSLQAELKITQQEKEAIAENLGSMQKTNETLGEELIKAQVARENLERELKKLKLELSNSNNKRVRKKVQRKKIEETEKTASNQKTSRENFTW